MTFSSFVVVEPTQPVRPWMDWSSAYNYSLAVVATSVNLKQFPMSLSLSISIAIN